MWPQILFCGYFKRSAGECGSSGHSLDKKGNPRIDLIFESFCGFFAFGDMFLTVSDKKDLDGSDRVHAMFIFSCLVVVQMYGSIGKALRGLEAGSGSLIPLIERDDITVPQ